MSVPLALGLIAAAFIWGWLRGHRSGYGEAFIDMAQLEDETPDFIQLQRERAGLQ